MLLGVHLHIWWPLWFFRILFYHPHYEVRFHRNFGLLKVLIVKLLILIPMYNCNNLASSVLELRCYLFWVEGTVGFWSRLTCIYLACKVEESHVSAEELGKGISQDPQVVLKNEMIVLQVSISWLLPGLVIWLQLVHHMHIFGPVHHVHIFLLRSSTWSDCDDWLYWGSYSTALVKVLQRSIRLDEVVMTDKCCHEAACCRV